MHRDTDLKKPLSGETPWCGFSVHAEGACVIVGSRHGNGAGDAARVCIAGTIPAISMAASTSAPRRFNTILIVFLPFLKKSPISEKRSCKNLCENGYLPFNHQVRHPCPESFRFPRRFHTQTRIRPQCGIPLRTLPRRRHNPSGIFSSSHHFQTGPHP